MPTLILLRHGQSTWNAKNRFTGWFDADLTERGEQEAVQAGTLLSAHGIGPEVVHTSVQTRAIRTASSRSGPGAAATAPRHHRSCPTIPATPEATPRYAALPDDLIPASESLADVLARVLPYWYDSILTDLARRVVLVVAHGSSLRALVKHLKAICRQRHRNAEHRHRPTMALRARRPIYGGRRRLRRPGRGRRAGQARRSPGRMTAYRANHALTDQQVSNTAR